MRGVLWYVIHVFSQCNVTRYALVPFRPHTPCMPYTLGVDLHQRKRREYWRKLPHAVSSGVSR
jgi:hypothetical protein